MWTYIFSDPGTKLMVNCCPRKEKEYLAYSKLLRMEDRR